MFNLWLVAEDDVIIGHMDCTAGDKNELFNSISVDGFPTLNIYKDLLCYDYYDYYDFSLHFLY